MDNSRLVVAIMLSLCLVAVIGCGDSPARESDTKVMAAAKGPKLRDPPCRPRAIGINATTVVKVVSRIGRSRCAPDVRTASSSGRPDALARLMKSTITSESFTTTPVRPIVAYIMYMERL